MRAVNSRPLAKEPRARRSSGQFPPQRNVQPLGFRGVGLIRQELEQQELESSMLSRTGSALDGIGALRRVGGCSAGRPRDGDGWAFQNPHREGSTAESLGLRRPPAIRRGISIFRRPSFRAVGVRAIGGPGRGSGGGRLRGAARLGIADTPIGSGERSGSLPIRELSGDRSARSLPGCRPSPAVLAGGSL